MAARRLLIVMLVLLGISTLAAALVPRNARLGQTSSTETATTKQKEPNPQARTPNGRALSVAIEVGGPKVPVVPIRVGDQLSLVVSSRRADLLEIPGFGLAKAVAPDAPARFDLLADRRGDYRILQADEDRLAARIRVAPARPRRAKKESTKQASGPLS